MKRHLRLRVMAGFFISILAFEVLGDGSSSPTLRIEPAVDRVPANHLKFYLHFPEPMERGEAFRHLRLVEIDGEGTEVGEVPEPFREVELWDETFTRMTLWFHPGRQKPGVNLNVEFGPILEEGKRYRLEVSRDWRTESGGALEGAISHEFAAGPLDDEQPDPEQWGKGYRIGGPNGPVTLVYTEECLDPESARRRIRIFVGDSPVDFSVEGNRLAFRHPEEGPAPFRLVIDPRLEDLAGNSIARPFNLNRETHPDFVERTEPVEIEFPRKSKLRADTVFP